MLDKYQFTKENLDESLRTLAKEYKRLIGKDMPAEIILVGGAAVLANYGFRDVTYDIDAIIEAASAMNDAIRNAGELLGLPAGWLNADFKNTSSYSAKLVQYSKYYKTFANVLSVRTISAEYLVAMKLMSGRKYKNDISDIVGILSEQKKNGKSLSFDSINTAILNLYASWDKLPKGSKALIEKLLATDNYEELYKVCREDEQFNQEILIDFSVDNPKTINGDNINSILEKLKAKK